MKFAVVTLVPVKVYWRFAGLKLTDVLLGVIVYEPFARPAKLKFPDESVMAVFVAAPPSATVTPAPSGTGVIVPEIAAVVGVPPPPPVVVAVKFTPVRLAPLTITDVVVGLKASDVPLGVTAYVPLARPVKL